VRAVKKLVRGGLARSVKIRWVWRAMMTLQAFRLRGHPWLRPHPFDLVHGISTNGVLPPWLLGAYETEANEATAYAGCQPSCVRRGLASIPDLQSRVFVDFGCGKGRALIVASERNPRAILGLELSPYLADMAERNAEIVACKFPGRTRIEVIAGDAFEAELPDADLVVFVYHAFSRALVARLAALLTEISGRSGREIFVILENPVFGLVFDEHPAFDRWFCAMVPCEADELGFAPDEEECVVVWRLGGPRRKRPEGDAGVAIVVTKEGWSARLATAV
jgi:SAM-dependent methyltransferase